MSTIQIFILGITLAAKYEPYIAGVLHLVVPALKKLHDDHDATVMLADISSTLRQFGIKPANVVTALQQASAAEAPAGNPDAMHAGSDNANI